MSQQITYRIIQRGDFEAIFSLCEALKIENARMSFTDVDQITDVIAWYEASTVYLYGAFNERNELVGLLKGTRGVASKAHSVYLAAAVSLAYRKLSIASDLTCFALSCMKQEGIKIARTYIYSWNKASIATIEKAGFIQSGRVYMHEYDEITQAYIDDLIFYKVL